MGLFIYRDDTKLDVEDRVLAHLELVITTKLRRDESFAFTWQEDVSMGSGRRKVWLHPAIPLVYRFYGNRPPAINRAWIEALMASADTTAGLVILPEPQ
ncbi:ATP-dependent DNA ligase [Microbacteriaceae bacterium VKM Ac-2854]|nr:ATP-dependent DNA ligase [Microbacteriaceae bacterium VKM Ac-2854]